MSDENNLSRSELAEMAIDRASEVIECLEVISNVIDFEVIANAIRGCFISPNVPDSNLEPANIVDAIANCANGLFSISKAINRLADVLENRGDGIRHRDN